MINSEMILNDQATLLSYSGDHEIERSKFEMGKKLGGGKGKSNYRGYDQNPAIQNSIFIFSLIILM